MALVRSAGEVARQLATQLELGAVERQRAELRDARLAALRSQMSPHFVYNTITAIASLVRTDPERARELLFRFAELCRYVLRNDHVTTTLAEELRIVHVYVELERARKGDRIEIVFRIDPATLSAPMPMMTLQPLVENAVQHGLADPAAIGRGGGARGVVTVEAQDHGDEMELTVADNGRGIEPAVLARLQSDGLPPGGRSSSASIAIANVRARLDAAFGTGARFAIESAPGEGTSVRLRLPKGGIGTGLGARP
jgi:two-component system LytT family sensor kinase